MTEPEPLFREEALEFELRQRGPGELVGVRSVWLDTAFWALLALVAAGLVITIVVHIGGEPLLFVLVPALKTFVEQLHG